LGIEAAVNALLWLDQLQAIDQTEVGAQLIALNQLHQSGCPGENGFIVPDGAMQTLWQQTDWHNEILQDFSSLNLSAFRDQTAQIQSIAQSLQQGILAQALSSAWAEAWQQALGEWRSPSILLSAYVWTTSAEQSAEFSKLLFLQPLMGSSDLTSFWTSLKTLWSQLFQAPNLHILGYLGLRPKQLHLSVLVQPLSNVKASGWLKITPDHLALEVVPQIRLDPWKGEHWPDCYLYDRLQAKWSEPFMPCAAAIVHPAGGTKKTTHAPSALISKRTLQTFVKWVKSIPSQADLDHPLTLAWMISKGSPLPKLIGFMPDLPLPLHPSLKVGNHPRSLAGTLRPAQQTKDAQPLAVGLGVSPGQITAPIVVVKSFDDISPWACRGVIIVTQQLDPLHLPWLEEAVGLLCEMGGAVSHGAILARELGCPAIVGLEGITTTLKTGQWVAFDGREGKLYQPTADGRNIFSSKQVPKEDDDVEQPSSISTQLFAILSQLNRLKEAQFQEIDGICLVRGEWLLLSQLATDRQPASLVGADYDRLGQQMGTVLATMAQAIAPRPVYYRSIDRPSDWDKGLSPYQTEQNPSLGLRGTLWHQKDARLLDMELAMLARLLDRGVNNLRLILPFVRSPQEVAFCIDKMHTAGIDQRLPLWLMAEVPSLIFSLRQYRTLGIQGIAIGSSDLAQLLLGIDRDHAAFMDILQQNQSVLNDAVRQLVQGATDLGLSSILCGDLLLAHQPNAQWLAQLIKAGLTGIAVELDAIAPTRRAIAQAEHHSP
jgi:pyruvate, water dikinase